MLNPPVPSCSTFILTYAHFSHSLPTAMIQGDNSPRLPLFIVREVDLIIMIIKKKCNFTGAHVCAYVQLGSSSAVLSASL